MYHSFCEDRTDRYHISSKAFEEQLYDISKRKDIIITIDDGVPSVFKIAIPLIKKYKIPTIIFIITSMIGKNVMTEKQIKEISDLGIKIQSHSHSHQNHNLLTTEEIIEEGKRSKEILENITNKEVNQYAFPNGEYNYNICETLTGIGYNEFFTSDYGTNSKKINRAIIHDRIEILGEESIDYYISNISIYKRRLRSKIAYVKKLLKGNRFKL